MSFTDNDERATANGDHRAYPRVWAIIVAAGRGHRFGAAIPKQYTALNGVPIIERTLMAFCDHSDIDAVLVGLADNDAYFDELGIEHVKIRGTFTGGSERHDTVRRGLQSIVDRGGANDWVLVHDAARPLVAGAEIAAIVAALKSGAPGAVLGLPVNDAVKRADNNNAATGIVDRVGLWRALTPQGFVCSALLEALTLCATRDVRPLDECEAMQSQGVTPSMVPGRMTNLKITGADDLALASAIVAMQQQERDQRS